MTIPISDKVPIKSTRPLDDLKDFDPKTAYAVPEGNPNHVRLMKKEEKQREMGVISNLITDMTLRGADEKELARAVKARLVYTSYIPLTDIDLVLPDDITQLTVTITAVFTPSDATDQRVTWELYNLPGSDITIISTTETTCTLKTSSINGGLITGRLKATTTNGSMSVSKVIRHNPANFLNKNGTWSW